MRAAKPSIIIGAVAVLAFSTMAVAGAFVSETSGQVIKLVPPPPSVAVNALEHATSAVAFDERQATTLTAPVAVDAVNPGTYTAFPNSAVRTIAAGTQVDSHLVHSDPPKGASATAQHRTGTLSFPADIIGVIGATARLGASDAALGAPGTTYAGTTANRGLEGTATAPQDNFTISNDRRSLSFNVYTTGVVDELRVVTRHVDVLYTVMSDAPDPVTTGNEVQYTLVVTNGGYSPVSNAHVIDTLPAGTTLVTTSAPGGCTGTGPVDCTLGPLAVGESATAKVLLTVPATVPAGGTITNRAVASPGANNNVAEQVTEVQLTEAGVTKGFVLPDESLGTSDDAGNQAVVTLPGAGCVNPPDGLHSESWPCSDGDGAPVEISHDDGTNTFCGGEQCDGPATQLNTPDGFFDPTHPMTLTETYTFNAEDYPGDASTAANAALNAAGYAAYGATYWKHLDNEPAGVGHQIPACPPGPDAGRVLGDYPDPVGACVASRSMTETSFGHYVSTVTIDWLSTDGKIARH